MSASGETPEEERPTRSLKPPFDNELGYQWCWCNFCQVWMVRCPTCGNNGCNAGSGRLENGEPCPDCEAAHAYEIPAYDPRWLGPDGQKHPDMPKDPAGYPAWEEEVRIMMEENRKKYE